MIHKVFELRFELRSEMKKLAIMAGCGLLMALGAAGECASRIMPTQEELSKAGPLIQELMRDDLAAMRNGKKTREQVGDIAVALAKEAQSPAEKYLLLTTAFDHYMRGGSYDKANSSLVNLRTVIPDWKHSDECALIEKSLRIIASGKGGPVRERYAALKERQQYALKLKKALEQAAAKPGDKKLQLQVAAYYAALDRWPQALDAFIAGSSPACAAAAKLEKESAAPGQIADAWWSASDIHPEFLSVAIRAHAVDLYKKAIAANSLAGLQKVAAEKRIAEAESAAAGAANAKSDSSSSASINSVGSAKFTGVKLVGSTVKLGKGVLSNFSDASYGLIDTEFSPGNETIETVVEFTLHNIPSAKAGLLGGLGVQDGFTPFYIVGSSVVGYLSSSGKDWDITSGLPIGLSLRPKDTYRVKCEWNGKEFVWSVWRGTWTVLRRLPSKVPVAGGFKIQFGTNRGRNSPFPGTIDLNKCYIKVGDKLWWEGVNGAYKNVNK